MDNGRRISTQFQGNLLFACFSFQVPPHLCTPRETQHFYLFMGGEFFRFGHVAGDDVQHSGGKSCLFCKLCKEEGRQWCLRWWLQNNRISNRQGRGNLVGHQIQGEIKRRNGRNGPHGKTAGEHGVALSNRGAIRGDDLSIHPFGFLSRNDKGRDRPVHLSCCKLPGFPRL